MSATKGRLTLILVFLFLYVPFLTTNGFQLADKKNIDLPSFYYASDEVFNQHESPYRPDAWSETEQKLQQKVFPYLYPPPSLLFFVPFSWFSYEGAKTAALVINHLSLLFLLYLLLFRIFRLPSPLEPPAAEESNALSWLILPVLLLYTLQFHPVVVTLRHGQINLVVMTQICLFWVWLREGKPAAMTAAPLALAIILKTYPAIFLPLLLVRRQYRIAAWTLGYSAALALASLVILPSGTWDDWIRFVAPTGGYAAVPFHLFSPAMPWNQSINGFTARLFLHPDYALALNPVAARLVPTLLAGLIVGILVWFGRRMNNRPRRRYVNEEIATVLLAIFLIAPLSWEHHLVFVLPAALLAVVHIFRGRMSVYVAVPVGLATGILAWPLSYLFRIEGGGPMSLLVSLKFYSTVTLLVYFLSRLWQTESVDQPARPGMKTVQG
ncbi:MAG: glycosyltransferase family 87 protein [Candidatus Krumholzibacteriota bacterium]